MVGDLRRLAIGRGQGGAGAKAPVRLIYVVDVDKLVHTSGYQEPGLRDPDVSSRTTTSTRAWYTPEEGALRLPYEALGKRGLGLNPEGRAGRGGFKAGLTPEEFTATVMKGLEGDVLEIGYGMTAGLLKASRAELDAAFQRMNSRW